MINFKRILTSLICIQFISVFTLFNIINLDKSNKIFGIEFESELESEVETENELKLKSKNHQFFKENLNFSFDSVGKSLFSFLHKSLSYKNYILEVPTSPPNNC